MSMISPQESLIDGLCRILAENSSLKRGDADLLKKEFSGYSDVSFEFFLVDQGLVEKDDLLGALAEYYQVPAIDVVGAYFDHNLLMMFPKDVMLRMSFIPYEHDGDVLLVIARNPREEALLQVIGKYVSYDIALMVGIGEDINDMVKEYSDTSPTMPELDLPEQEKIKEKDAHDILDDMTPEEGD